MRQCVKNVIERGRPRIAISRMRIPCWIPKATDTHSEYVILISFPLQQLLHESASELRHKLICCVVWIYKSTVWYTELLISLQDLEPCFQISERNVYLKSLNLSHRAMTC
jgi:hypothetical protein